MSRARVYKDYFEIESARALSHLGIKLYSTIQYPTVDGIKVKVRSSYFWKRLESGQWEPNCIKHVSNITREGQVIFDVGAWIGPYTLLFSKLVQATGRVYAFDCDPKQFDILRDNIEKNRLTNVHIEKICISNCVGQAKFYVFGESLSSIVEHKQRKKVKEIMVEITTIDKYCEENGIFPDGLKIDVEGAEGLVIEGCQKTIKKHSPWILLEFHSMLMSEKEKRTTWRKMTHSAKKITFIGGNTNQYHYGNEVEFMPDCPNFKIFIEY